VVVLRGACLGILDMVPELEAHTSDPPPTLAGAKLLPYSIWAWFTLAATITREAELPLQSLVWRFVVSPVRMGIAFEAEEHPQSITGGQGR